MNGRARPRFERACVNGGGANNPKRKIGDFIAWDVEIRGDRREDSSSQQQGGGGWKRGREREATRLPKLSRDERLCLILNFPQGERESKVTK